MTLNEQIPNTDIYSNYYNQCVTYISQAQNYFILPLTNDGIILLLSVSLIVLLNDLLGRYRRLNYLK